MILVKEGRLSELGQLGQHMTLQGQVAGRGKYLCGSGRAWAHADQSMQADVLVLLCIAAPQHSPCCRGASFA